MMRAMEGSLRVVIGSGLDTLSIGQALAYQSMRVLVMLVATSS